MLVKIILHFTSQLVLVTPPFLAPVRQRLGTHHGDALCLGDLGHSVTTISEACCWQGSIPY